MEKLELFPAINEALRDYFDLLNRGYPEKRTRLLVADRYRLNRSMRSLLFRGVFPDRINRYRSSRRREAPFPPADFITVDFLNVLLVLMNYLYGRGVFISSDGYVRDEGENYRRFGNSSVFKRSLLLFKEALPRIGAVSCLLLVDEKPAALLPPELKEVEVLAAALRTPGRDIQIRRSRQVKREMIGLREGVIATSDSRVLDRSPLPATDLAGFVLEDVYAAPLTDLRSILYPSG